MANNSVLGRTRVSGALIQTSEARRCASLIVWECVIISALIGSLFDSFWTLAVLTFIVLLILVDTVVWTFISYAISIFVGYVVGQAAYSPDSSMFSALVFFLLAFGFMISWHHWGLAYWRGLSE